MWYIFEKVRGKKGQVVNYKKTKQLSYTRNERENCRKVWKRGWCRLKTRSFNKKRWNERPHGIIIMGMCSAHTELVPCMCMPHLATYLFFIILHLLFRHLSIIRPFFSPISETLLSSSPLMTHSPQFILGLKASYPGCIWISSFLHTQTFMTPYRGHQKGVTLVKSLERKRFYLFCYLGSLYFRQFVFFPNKNLWNARKRVVWVRIRNDCRRTYLYSERIMPAVIVDEFWRFTDDATWSPYNWQGSIEIVEQRRTSRYVLNL